jgi:ABC-type branched-subunit amino acid transport system substrate-binding protein
MLWTIFDVIRAAYRALPGRISTAAPPLPLSPSPSLPCSPVPLLLLLFLLTTACASVEPVVKIGLVAPFEGRERPVGYDVIYSARLAVREVNQAGGIGGYRVALVALDDSGDPELARQTAAALVIDPQVVAVIGHWLPETTAVALPIYTAAAVPFIAVGEGLFGPVDPGWLPQSFQQAYAAVTPFDEVAGPYAGPAYDALGLILAAMAEARANGVAISRQSVQAGLQNLTYQGITGQLYQP